MLVKEFSDPTRVSFILMVNVINTVPFIYYSGKCLWLMNILLQQALAFFAGPERERHTQRETQRQRETERDTHRERDTQRETERDTERQRERQRETQRDRERHTQREIS